MSQLRRGAIVPSVFYILLLTPGFACADPVWSSACVWPQTTQANPVDIKHMKPEELNEYETILNTVKLIHVACFNEEVFEIIHNIKTDDARDLVVAFYVYIDHDFHYVGSFGANRKIFKTEIINHDHYFVRNFYHLYIGNGRSWIIDKLIMIPHVKADIIQFCDDIHCKCEIDDFDDDSIKPLTKVGELGKTAAVCEYLVAKDEGNQISNAFNTDAIINANDDSTTDKLNQICADTKLFKLPCICNNGNRYSNPYVDRFLKPCVYLNPEKYQNICPYTKLSNLLGPKSCKFMSNLCPFLCKNLPSIGIDKPSFNSITQQIYPLNFLQKLYPLSQYSKCGNPNLYYATYNKKPNINDILYEYPPNTEKSNEFYENGKVNSNDNKYPINVFSNDQNTPINDNDNKFVPNITPNGQTTAICNVHSNVKKSQFTVFSSQALPTNNNENNKVVITGQPQFISNQNPFSIVMENCENSSPLELNALCENEGKLTKLQGFSVDEIQAPLPKMLENGKLVVGKIPERPDSSVTNVWPNNKLTYYLQNADSTTINESQKFPEDKTKSASHVFITNNNYPNFGIATTDVGKQTIEPLESKYDEVISENIGNRFISEKSEPLATTLYPKIVPTIKNDKIEYSDAIPSKAPQSHGDLNIDRDLPQILSEKKYEKIPIGSNINIFPESMVTSGLPNRQSTDTLSGSFHVMPSYKTYNNGRIQLVSPENVYAVNNNKIQSAQPNMSNELFPYSLSNEQISTNPPISFQLKSNLPIKNTDIGVLQLNNEYMNPKATTFAKLPVYETLNGHIDDIEKSSVQDIDTLTGSILEVPDYKANNGGRIQFENPQNVIVDNNKIQSTQNNVPNEVISYSIPEEQISVEPLICYDSKFNLNTPNTNSKVLELNNRYINPKTFITYTKLPEYKVPNKEIVENVNPIAQGIDTLTGNILVPPDNTIQLNNSQNTYAAPYNKIQSPQHNIPNEIFSYSLPDEQIVVNPFNSKSNLNPPTRNTNMRMLHLNNEHMNPKATKTFTKSPEYEIPCSVSDANKKADGPSINTLTDDMFVTLDYETDNDDRKQLNNLQNAYVLNSNETPTVQNNIPSEMLSYSLPIKRITVNSLTDPKRKFDLPTPNILQFNKNINPKDAIAFTKLPEFEIPCSETDKNEKTDGPSIDTLTGGHSAIPDYKTNNDDKIQLNNPQNIYGERYNKIPSAQNIISYEILSNSLPEKQITANLPISYQQKLNQLTPNILQIQNPKATIAFTKLPEYKIPCSETNRKKADIPNIDTLKGDFFGTTNYKTDNNDRKQLTNPQNAYVLNSNRIPSIQNNIPSEFLSYSFPIQQIAVNSLINPKPKFDLLTPSILQLNNKDMIPKATIALTKLSDFEIPCSEIDRNKNADGQSINTVTGGHFIAPDHKTDNNDEIQMNNPQNIYGENYKKIPSDQSIVPYEILSYPLPEKQIAANLPISYEPKLNQLTPTVFQIKHEHMNPKAPIAFTELPEYEIPCNDTAENNKAEGPSIDTLTGDLLGTSDYKTDNNQRIQLNYPENAYAVNNNGIPSTRNNIPNEVMSNSLPGEVIAVNPPISYQPKLNLPAPNILQLNNKDINPKATIELTKLPVYEIPCSEIGGNEKADGQSINTVTGGHFIAPDYKTDNNDGIQLKNPQNIYGENYKKIPSDQNIVPYEILPYLLPEKQITANLPISYESKLNQLTPNVFQIKHEHINPKAPIAFTEISEYEIPCSETAENKKAEGPSIDTLTGDLLGTPDYNTDNNQRIQLNYPENAYAVNNNRIPSTRNNIPSEVMSNSLPGEAIAVNPPISFQSKLNLPAPNILQLNNKDNNLTSTTALSKLPDYKIPCSVINESVKANKQGLNTLIGDLPVAPNNKLDNYDRIQLNNPQISQNLYALNNNKIPSTQNNLPFEALYSLPEKLIEVVENQNINPLTNYESKLNIPTPTTDVKMLHLNNDPKATLTFEIPNSQMDEKENPNIQSIDSLTDSGLAMPYYKTDDSGRIQVSSIQNVYGLSKNKTQSPQNIPDEVLSYSLPNEQISVKPSISYESKLNLPTSNILQLNSEYTNPNTVRTFENIRQYQTQNNRINENLIVQDIDALTSGVLVTPDKNIGDIILDNTQNVYLVNNNKIQDTQNNILNDILPHSLSNEQIVNPPIIYQKTPTADMKVLHLNKEYTNPKATVTFAQLPEYEIADNSHKIQLKNPQNVYDIHNNKIQSTRNYVPKKIITYSLPNAQISVKPPISYPSQLNVPTLNTNMGLLQLNNDYINPKVTTIDKEENPNVQSVDTVTSDLFATPDYKTENNDLNHHNVYAMNNNKIKSAPNNVPYKVLPCSWPYGKIADNSPLSYQSHLNEPMLNIGTGILQLNNDYMDQKGTITFGKSPQYELLSNQINKKGEPNKQSLDLTGSFVNVNSVYSPQNVKTGIYGPMQMYSAPVAVVNPSATNIISTETNNHIPVNIKPEKDYVPNYSNSNYYTLMNSGQINDEIVSPKETADEIKMHQINYIPKELTQSEVPQQIIFKNNERNDVPKENYVEFDSTLPKYTNLNTYNQLHEVIPKFAPSGKNNLDVVNPLLYDGIQIKDANYMPLYMNADVDVTNVVKENKYPSYLHQKENFSEDSKHIDKVDEEYTKNVGIISKNENNNAPEYAIPIQAALYNPQINIGNIKLETIENGNQLCYPSENLSYVNQPSIGPISLFKTDERKKGNIYNIQNNEYVNLPFAQKFSNPNDRELNSEVANVYDIELKSKNKASMLPYEGSDQQQHELDNNVNENLNIEALDVNPACITNLNYSNKGTEEPNLEVKQTPDKPAFTNFEVTDTKKTISPEQYEIKHTELVKENNAKRKTDGNAEIPNIELHEILSEMTTLPVNQSADNHFKSLDQPIEIKENNYRKDYQHLNKNYKLYEEKTCESLPFEINSGPDKYINPTREEFSALNEIKYDESSPLYTPIPSSIASSSNSIPFYKNSISDSTIPCTDISPGSENYLKPFTGATSLPQSWLTYDSSKPTEQSLLTSVSPIYNVNPCLSQNINQPTIAFSQAQSTIVNALKSNLLNYIRSNGNVIDNTVSIPLGDLGVAKYDPIENTKYFTINTENDDINLKAWYSKLKLIKAKITFETVEASALNFIPIVCNKSKYCPVKVQEIAKNAISKVYGEPIVIKGVYTFDIPYVIVDNVDSACIYNGGYILLWPTYCDCGCQKAGCQCYLQNFNDRS
ncbi:uncharacterized protein [Choristoneura fumiferana]|uniref:uncharacterized protein n=1 Tax=Choristoneura fumiferana TaxID=7141 RepID=UPI003D15DEF5